MAGLEIPEHCGAILLEGLTLFPQGALPLHIFEPRYREMLDDAMSGTCLFCLGTLIDKESADLPSCVAPIGTIGLVRASRDLEDGRSNLLLHGVLRVRFVEWLDDKPYPYAHIVPALGKKMDPADADAAAKRLMRALEIALSGLPEPIREPALANARRAAAYPETLADVVSQQFVQDQEARRWLLEETDTSKRFEFLIRNIEQSGEASAS